MAATDRFSSIDETIKAIRDEHDREMQSCRDTTLAAQIEAGLAKAQLKEALADRDKYMRIATKFVTQLATVESVLADVKRMALEYSAAQEAEDKATAALESQAKAEPPAQRASADPTPAEAGHTSLDAAIAAMKTESTNP